MTSHSSCFHLIEKALHGNAFSPQDFLSEFCDYAEKLPTSSLEKSLEFVFGHICGFRHVDIKTKQINELHPDSECTSESILASLHHECVEYGNFSCLRDFRTSVSVNKIGIKPSSGINTIAFLNIDNTVLGYLSVAQASHGTSFLIEVLYIPSADSLYLFIPQPGSGTFSTLVRIFNRLFGGQGLEVLGEYRKRQEAYATIQLRDRYIHILPFWQEHLGHYILNYLGPLSYGISSGRYLNQDYVFISKNLSHLGPFERDLIEHIESYGRIKGKIIYVDTVKEAMSHAASLGSYGILLLEDSIVPLALAESVSRVLQRDSKPTSISLMQDNASQSLVIGVGLRGGTRMIVNLASLLENLTNILFTKIPNLRLHYIFDGMCSLHRPEVGSTSQLSLDRELEEYHVIRSKLLMLNATTSSTIALPLYEQILSLSSAHVILAHNGSGSAKYSWLLNKYVFVLNNQFHEPAWYSSWKDSQWYGQVGLKFCRAFRKDVHSPEYYLPKTLLTPAPENKRDFKDGATGYTDYGRSRGNHLINAERAATLLSIEIVDLLRNLSTSSVQSN
jgi:hypothetical protein